MTSITARERLIAAAVESFAEKGFTATTTRDIASRAGMSPAAVYVHHDSKESLLFTVSEDGHRRAQQVIDAAYAAESEPVARVRRMIHDFSMWHAQNSRVGRIVQYEFEALSPEHRAQIAAYRRRIEEKMGNALADGVDQGVLAVRDVHGTARALLSLSIDLVRWYSPAGAQKPDEIASLHAELAVRMVT